MRKWPYIPFGGLCLLICLLVAKPQLAHAQISAKADSLSKALVHSASDTTRVEILLHLSRLYKPDSVIKEFYYATEALNISEQAKWLRGAMMAEELIAECYITVTSYADAIIHFNRAMALSRKIGQPRMERVCLQYLVHCYHSSNHIQQAYECQKALLERVTALGDQLGECRQMATLGIELSALNRNDEAIYYMHKEIALARTRFDDSLQKDVLADLYNTLCGFYLAANKIDSALGCLRIAEKLTKEVQDEYLTSYILSSFFDVYVAAKKYDSAIAYGKRAIEMGEAQQNTRLLVSYYDPLARAYEHNNMPREALRYYRRSDSLSAIVNNTTRTLDQAMQVTKITMEQQAAAIKSEEASFEAIKQNQHKALIAAIIAMAALVSLTIFIYRSLKQKQEANKLIDQALKEKEMLLKETHHRIKNNLQLVSSLLELQLADISDESARNALRTAQRRVMSIASVHGKLYGSSEFETVEFSSFVTDLFTSLYTAFGRDAREVKLQNTIPSVFFTLDTLIPLGLILNELITNSFKHAFTGDKDGLIRIDLKKDERVYTLTYTDNGTGLAPGQFEAGSGSLGLYLIKRLSKQLKGRTEYKFDSGSIFTIIFHDAGN